MKFIVIGYRSFAKSAEGEVVYAGNSGAAADDALFREEEGIVRKGIIKFPAIVKTREFPGQAAPAPAEEEPAPAPAEEALADPAPEAPAPVAEETAAEPADEPQGLARIARKK
jgi:hypothetical protein